MNASNTFAFEIKHFQCPPFNRENCNDPKSVEEEKFLRGFKLGITSFPPKEELIQYLILNEKQTPNAKKHWNKPEKIALVWIVYNFTRENCKKIKKLVKEDWVMIGSFLNRNGVECVFQFHSLLAQNIQINEWSKEEKTLLSEIIKSQSIGSGKIKWNQIARELYERSPFSIFRTDKMIRSYWMSHLDPKRNKIIGWTSEEDLILLQEYLETPSKWALIASKLCGRNEFDTKNRFISLCKIHKIRLESFWSRSDIQSVLEKLRFSIFQEELGKQYPKEWAGDQSPKNLEDKAVNMKRTFEQFVSPYSPYIDEKYEATRKGIEKFESPSQEANGSDNNVDRFLA